MIKVSVFFPQKAGAKFNMKYYVDNHIPMLKSKLGEACKGVVLDRGLRGGAPNTPAHFVVVCNLLFDNMRAFQGAFRPHVNEILADLAKVTTIPPRIQISETTSL
jgi:uncharacterized protein (TIGR02118 family)